MSAGSISPTRRFQTVIIRTDDASPGKTIMSLPVDQDIVVHSVNLTIGFACPTGTFAFVGVGKDDSGGAWGDGVQSASWLAMSWSNLHATVARPSGTFNQSQDLGAMLLSSGSRIIVTRITNQSAGATSSISGTMTICFSTRAEWDAPRIK